MLITDISKILSMEKPKKQVSGGTCAPTLTNNFEDTRILVQDYI